MNTKLTLQAPGAGRYFVKMHGLENHFVITDARDKAYAPDAVDIARICNPRIGVGADQLIVVEPPRNESADVFMRIYNVDGREAEACGNATRCVAWLLMEEAGRDAIVIETLAGKLDCRRAGDHEVRSEMGSLTMAWQAIPLAEQRDTCHLDIESGPLRDGVAVSIGNPHVVFFVDDLDAVDVATCAPAIQTDELFPAQVNVGVAERVADDHLKLVVFERGAGLTTACGSGACAAHFAALARGLTDRRRVTVSMPAGDVTIEIDERGVATMTGPVAYCFSGYY